MVSLLSVHAACFIKDGLRAEKQLTGQAVRLLATIQVSCWLKLAGGLLTNTQVLCVCWGREGGREGGADTVFLICLSVAERRYYTVTQHVCSCV